MLGSLYLFLIDHLGPVDLRLHVLRSEVVDLVVFRTQVCDALLQLPDAEEREKTSYSGASRM